MTKVHEFSIDMKCQGCVKGIEAAIKKLGSHAQDVIVSFETKRVTLKSDLDPDKIIAALKKTGKNVEYIGEKK